MDHEIESLDAYRALVDPLAEIPDGVIAFEAMPGKSGEACQGDDVKPVQKNEIGRSPSDASGQLHSVRSELRNRYHHSRRQIGSADANSDDLGFAKNRDEHDPGAVETCV